MAEMFGVRPWEMELMRLGELEACSEYVNQRNAQSG